jgi:hypothetical protein
VAIDPKHLPEDAKVLQRMVLDLMAQLDREFTERNKIEALLRELLDARRDRKSEQLSDEQLALFAAVWQARQAEAEAAAASDHPEMMTTMLPAPVGRLRRKRQAVGGPGQRISSASVSNCHRLKLQS